MKKMYNIFTLNIADLDELTGSDERKKYDGLLLRKQVHQSSKIPIDFNAVLPYIGKRMHPFSLEIL